MALLAEKGETESSIRLWGGGGSKPAGEGTKKVRRACKGSRKNTIRTKSSLQGELERAARQESADQKKRKPRHPQKGGKTRGSKKMSGESQEEKN